MTTRRGSSTLRALLALLLLALLAGGGAVGYRAWERHSWQPLVGDARLAVARIARTPAFRARAAGRDTAAAVASLAAAGLRRLDDSIVVRHAALVGRVLAAADTATCARLAAGPLLLELLRHPEPLGAVDPAVARLLVDDMVFAADAELADQRPPRVLSDDEAVSAMTALLRLIPERERDRLVHALTAPTSVGVGERCWAARTLYAGVARIDEAERPLLARAALPGS